LKRPFDIEASVSRAEMQRERDLASQRRSAASSVALMRVFPNELEAQAEFDGFTEWLQTFELYRGKKSVDEFDDDGRVVGKFKVRDALKWENLHSLFRIFSFCERFFFSHMFFLANDTRLGLEEQGSDVQ